jgi:hypothetical protein
MVCLVIGTFNPKFEKGPEHCRYHNASDVERKKDYKMELHSSLPSPARNLADLYFNQKFQRIGKKPKFCWYPYLWDSQAVFAWPLNVLPMIEVADTALEFQIDKNMII